MDDHEYELAHDGTDAAGDAATDDGDERGGPAVERPLDLLRIGTLVQTMLAEVRGIELDEAGRARLAQLHGETVEIVRRAVSPELEKELDDLVSSFAPDRTPSQAELRVAQAELAGWLQGLFHGIQASALSRGGEMAAVPGALAAGTGGPTGYL